MIYPGLEIDDYVIEDELGRGGFGSVFLAKDKNEDIYVAIKFLHPKILRSEENKQAFINEMINQARVSLNPNIVQVIRCVRYTDKQGEHLGMVMEYVEGDPLDLFIQKYAPLPEFVACPIFIQVLNGIAYAHRHNMLHRDMKPGNILINEDGVVKIMDFGLSKVLKGISAASESARAASLNYVAPERLEKGRIDIRTDLYSLGATFYEVLTGKPPYEIEFGDWKEATLKHKSGEYKSIQEFYPNHSDELNRVINKALNPDPYQRYEDCEEMLNEIKKIWSSIEVPSNIKSQIKKIIDATKRVTETEIRDKYAAGIPTFDRKPVDKEAERRKKLDRLKNEIIFLFDSGEYSESLKYADEYLELDAEDQEIDYLKEKILRINEILVKVDKARKNKYYFDLIDFNNEIFRINKNDANAKEEAVFLERAIDFLSRNILKKILNNKENYEGALDKLSKLINEAPPFYKNDLKAVQSELINEKKEKERKQRLEGLNKIILDELKRDDYKKALTFIKEAEKIIKTDEKRFYTEKKCLEAISIEENIQDIQKKKDYATSLELLKKLSEINPYSENIKERINIYQLFCDLTARLSPEKDPYKIFTIKKEFENSHSAKLPEDLVKEIKTIFSSKNNIIQKEKNKLLRQAGQYWEEKMLSPALASFQAVLSIEEDQNKIKQLDKKIKSIKSEIFKQKQKKFLKYFSITASVVLIFYILTGPVPRFIKIEKIKKNLKETALLIDQGNFEEAENKAQHILHLQSKLRKKEKMRTEIDEVFHRVYKKLIPHSDKNYEKNSLDRAIADAEKAISFAGFSSNLKEEAEKTVRELKYIKYYKLGEQFYRNQDYDHAIENFEVAKNNENKIQVRDILKNVIYDKHLTLGKTLYEEGKYDEGLRNFLIAQKQKDTNEILVLILETEFILSKNSGDFDKAFLKLIELNKAKGQSYFPFNLLHKISYTNSSGYPEIMLKGIKFVYIRGGEFEMGCFTQNCSDDTPLHKVSLGSFWISKTEITEAQYRGSGNKKPTRVSWSEAFNFAQRFGRSFDLKGNLPTEAQWEFVARNRGKKVIYPWGNDIDCNLANYRECGLELKNVGSYPANQFGIFDLSGNIREWCRDVYREEYYMNSPLQDPFNKSGSTWRVIRGGSYADNSIALKTFFRYSKSEKEKDDFTGFRIVLER